MTTASTTPSPRAPHPPRNPPGEPTQQPTGPPACTDPAGGDPVSSVAAEWRYDGSDLTPPDTWFGGAIGWPSWSAFSSNSRAGLDARTGYSASGQKLDPYLGEWADGCQIEVVSGNVVVIESNSTLPVKVSLSNCTAQQIDKGSSD